MFLTNSKYAPSKTKKDVAFQNQNMLLPTISPKHASSKIPKFAALKNPKYVAFQPQNMQLLKNQNIMLPSFKICCS